MKLLYGEVEALYETLQRLGGLTGKYGLEIAKTRKALEGEYSVFSEIKNNLMKKYGKEENGMIAVKPDMIGFKDFLSEYEKLLNTKSDVNITQIEDTDFMPDKIYCETATANDYAIFEQFMIKKPEKPKEESDADAEGKV